MSRKKGAPKKIPIIDILNKKFTPSEDYNEYLNIKICRSDLETIFAQDLVKGIQEIIQNCPDLNCYTPSNCGINRIILTNNCCYTTIYFCLLLYCNFSH